MPSMTSQEYEAYLSRAGGQRASAPPDAIQRESDLHDQIMADIRRRGWLAVHSRMDMATTTAVGVPDFVIMGDKGRIWWIECKAKRGKLEPEQLAFHAQAARLGHKVSTVWNFTEYLNAITIQEAE